MKSERSERPAPEGNEQPGARRLREMNKLGEGQREVGCRIRLGPGRLSLYQPGRTVRPDLK